MKLVGQASAVEFQACAACGQPIMTHQPEVARTPSEEASRLGTWTGQHEWLVIARNDS